MNRDGRKKLLKKSAGNKRKRNKLKNEQNDQDIATTEQVIEDPLTNWIVLRNIFQYLPEKELRSCRRVHTSWTPEADLYLKTRCKYINFNRFPHCWRTDRFIRLVKKSQSFPFTKIELPFGPRKLPPDEEMKFLSILAPNLTGLKLGVDSLQPWCSTFPELLQLPALTELEFWEDSELNLGSDYQRSFIPRVLENYGMQLTSLICNNALTSTLEVIGNNATMQLTKLQLHNYFANEIDLVQEILNNHKDTLVHLDLLVYWEDSNNSWLEPLHYPKLQSLKLGNICDFDDHEGDENPFPSLVSLTISPGEEQMLTPDYITNLLNGKPAIAVESLKLPCCLAPGYYPDMTKVIGQYFPNVKRLLINGVNPIDILRLLESLTKMTELEIWLEESDDEENPVESMTAKLTGLQFHVYNDWTKWTENDFEEAERECKRKIKGQAPYCALQQIRRVTLFYRGLEGKMLDILELPCRLVFLQMTNLAELTIQRSTEKKRERFVLSQRMQKLEERMKQSFVVTWETFK